MWADKNNVCKGRSRNFLKGGGAGAALILFKRGSNHLHRAKGWGGGGQGPDHLDPFSLDLPLDMATGSIILQQLAILAVCK